MAKPNKYGKGAFKPLNIVPEDEFGVLPEPIDFTRTRYGYEYRGGGVDSSGASSAASFTDSGHGDSPYLGDFGMFMEGRQVAEKSYEENIEDFRNAIEQENIESFKEIVARNNFILEDRIYVDGDKDLSLVEYLFEYEYKGDESFLYHAFDKFCQILFRDVSKYINFDTGYISGLYLDIIDRIISNSNKFLASDLLKNIRQNIPNEVSPRGQAAKDEVLDIVLECSMMNDGDVSCREVFDMFCDSSDFVRLFDFKKKESSFLFDLIINSENCEFIRSCLNETQFKDFYEILFSKIEKDKGVDAAKYVFEIAKNDWSLIIDIIEEKGGEFVFGLVFEGLDLMQLAIDEKNARLAEYLKDNGWDLTKKYEGGRNILHFIAEKNDETFLNLLFNYELLLQESAYGLDVAHHAIAMGHFDFYQEICEICASQDLSDPVNAGKLILMAIGGDYYPPKNIFDFLTVFPDKINEVDPGTGCSPVYYVRDLALNVDLGNDENYQDLLRFLNLGFDFNVRDDEGKALAQNLIEDYSGNAQSTPKKASENFMQFISLAILKSNNVVKQEIREKFPEFSQNVLTAFSFIKSCKVFKLSKEDLLSATCFLAKMFDTEFAKARDIHAFDYSLGSASRVRDINSGEPLEIFEEKQSDHVRWVNFFRNTIFESFRDSVFLTHECRGIFETLEDKRILNKQYIGDFIKEGLIKMIKLEPGESVDLKTYEAALNSFYECLGDGSEPEFATSLIGALLQKNVQISNDEDFIKVTELLSKSYDAPKSVFRASHSKKEVLDVALKAFDQYAQGGDLPEMPRTSLIDLVQFKRGKDSLKLEGSEKRRRVDGSAPDSTPARAVEVSKETAKVLDALAGNRKRGHDM